MLDDDSILSLLEVSRHLGITKQAVYCARKTKRLKGVKEKNGRWYFKMSDVRDYQVRRYSRKYTRLNGKFLYNKDEGRHSPTMIAEEMGVRVQHVYYLIRKGMVNARKVGGMYVIEMKPIGALANKE